MRVLALGAHPDDIELLCAGTLARYADEGHDVYMAIATNGELASPSLSRSEIAQIRYEEARSAARIIGANLIWLGFQDGFLFSSQKSRLRFVDALRQADPDVLFVHSPNDYHPDHRAAGQIAVDARMLASVRLIETGVAPSHRIPQVFFMDTLGALNFEPEVFVDITPTIEIKRKMLSMHVSQNEWLHDLHGMDYIEFMDSQARLRGLQSDVAYAEGIQCLRTYPASSHLHLLPSTG